MMSVYQQKHAWHLEGNTPACPHAGRLGRCATACLFLVSSGFLLATPAFAVSQVPHVLLAAQPAVDSAQVSGMAGYVLNAETGMNTVYTRKLNRELMAPPSSNLDDGPLIRYEGPPPQPPAGSLVLPHPQTGPTLP